MIAALLRHGAYEQPPDVPSAHLPHPLTLEGREEARRAAAQLRTAAEREGWTFDPVIDTSPLLRAFETATILAQTLEALTGMRFRIQEVPALLERSLGAAANLTAAAIEQAVERDPRYASLPPGWKRDPAHRLPFPGAETLLEAGARTLEHLRQRPAAPDSLTIFVGHGGAFRHAALLAGILDRAAVHRLSMHHAVPIFWRRDATGEFHPHGGFWKERSEHALHD